MADELTTAVDRLVAQVAHWELPRWSTALPSGGTRAERVFGLVQRLADRAADAEGEPRREVPRLGPQNLADQVRVMAADLVLAGADPAVLADAAADVLETRRLL
ncbi:hypothetical protein [Spirilliplanes yamanashiensis]|uniref:hypothetical protein n=1 Tax=Spirilliplanes yamanashiensis TaxID=42233 RepID=UPI001950ABCC|nr:hypothetical protein [Spirilliplanes yamanashiensis]MDP9816050.1 hypothetical protein [Spirilliplanes yamanashiensis]